MTETIVSDARERILDAAYELFTRRGLYQVGIEEIIERASVAKATLYRHFPSKEHLELAFLERRDERWTRGWLIAEVRRRASTPEQQLLAIFDAMNDWFRSSDFEGCSFVNALLEMGPDDAVTRASLRYLETIQGFERSLAEHAQLTDPEGFTRSFHILKRGAIMAAEGGDTGAALRAKQMARRLIDEYRPQAAIES
jgi:AcrR family transcriptional regulator